MSNIESYQEIRSSFCDLDVYFIVEKLIFREKYDADREDIKRLIKDIHSRTRKIAETFEVYMKIYCKKHGISCPEQEIVIPELRYGTSRLTDIGYRFHIIARRIDEDKIHATSVYDQSDDMRIIINAIDRDIKHTKQLFDVYSDACMDLLALKRRKHASMHPDHP